MKAVLLPFKNPEFAKTRLVDFLSAEQRRQLSWTMFGDVTRALAGARVPDKVFVATNYEPAAERAQTLGWEVFFEERQLSESASVDWASRLLVRRGVDIVMRLPADIPLVQSADIDQILSIELPSPGALLVSSRDGTGTNAITRTPADIFPSRFGPNSLKLHQDEAASRGVECTVATNSRIGLDIDDIDDVRFFMRLGLGTETFSLLSKMKLSLEMGSQS
jgi:2-phospho-L-lactate guanylyltransferase